MSLINNEIEEALIKKEEDSLSEKLKLSPSYYKTIKEMLVDYVTNNLSIQLLSEKYHFSTSVTKQIARKFKFESRKKEYDRKLLDIVLGKAQKQQASIIAKITSGMNEQVNRILKKQDDPNYIIPSAHMKELVAMLSIFTKEHRLDNDQDTDRIGYTVKVVYPDHVPIITNNAKKTIDVEVEKEIEAVKEVIEETKQEEIILNEDEPSIDNASFFGSIS